MVSPREGHLHQVYHIFAYLKQFTHSMLIFDDSEPSFSDTSFHACNWSNPDANEQIPRNMPEPLGHYIATTCYVDADHGECKAIWQSHTGLIKCVNQAPFVWFSKHQNKIESSTYGQTSSL
jgi:hypothetical protein